MTIRTSPRFNSGFISPQFAQAFQTLLSEFGLLSIPGQPKRHINMGPQTDTLFDSNKHNIFAGSTTHYPVKHHAKPSYDVGSSTSEPKSSTVQYDTSPSVPVTDASAVAAGGHKHPNLDVKDPNQYRGLVESALKNNNLDPKKYENIILAMIWQESKGDPKAVGSDGQGSKGLLQVIAANQNGEEHFDPEVSINGGVKEFASHVKQNPGNLAAALGGYNQGEGAKTGTAATTYATQIQNKAKFFEKGQTPAGQPDPTSPGFIEPPIGGKSGDKGTPGVSGASGPTSGASGPVSGDPSGPLPGGVSSESANGASGASGPAAPSASGPDSSSSGGSNQAYVDMMMKALKDNGAPPELLDAYMKQYQLLGLTGGGPSSGSSGPAAAPSGPVGDGASGPAASGPVSGGSSGPLPGGVFSEGKPSGPAGASGPVGASGPAGASGGPSGAAEPSGSISSAPTWQGTGKIQWDKAPQFIKKWKSEIEFASQKSGMPESLLAGMITNESEGNDKIITTNPDPQFTGDYAKDVGLMQINGNTYEKEIAAKHPDLPKDKQARYDMKYNLLAGAYHVKDLPYNTWEAKLRAYNSGPDCTDPSNPDPIKPNKDGQTFGTVNYPSKIKGLADRLEKGTLNW